MEREYDYTWYNNWMLDHESKRVNPEQQQIQIVMLFMKATNF